MANVSCNKNQRLGNKAGAGVRGVFRITSEAAFSTTQPGPRIMANAQRFGFCPLFPLPNLIWESLPKYATAVDRCVLAPVCARGSTASDWQLPI